MATTTNVKQVKLNIMTQSQYNSATKNANELYMLTDAQINYNDLINKPNIPSVVSSVDSSSTNSEAVGAKLFYDTCGDIETLINALQEEKCQLRVQ